MGSLAVVKRQLLQVLATLQSATQTMSSHDFEHTTDMDMPVAVPQGLFCQAAGSVGPTQTPIALETSLLQDTVVFPRETHKQCQPYFAFNCVLLPKSKVSSEHPGSVSLH